jgi:hypothetical protein
MNSLVCCELMLEITTVNSILKGSDDGVLYLIKPRFWTLSIITGYKNTTFQELALLLSSGKRGSPTQSGPLERASLSLDNLSQRTETL